MIVTSVFQRTGKKLSVSKSNMVYYISRIVTNKYLEIKEKVEKPLLFLIFNKK